MTTSKGLGDWYTIFNITFKNICEQNTPYFLCFSLIYIPFSFFSYTTHAQYIYFENGTDAHEKQINIELRKINFQFPFSLFFFCLFDNR